MGSGGGSQFSRTQWPVYKSTGDDRQNNLVPESTGFRDGLLDLNADCTVHFFCDLGGLLHFSVPQFLHL